MEEKTIQFDKQTYTFQIDKETWNLKMAKSLTYVKSRSQMSVMTETSALFAPVSIMEEEDSFHFSFSVHPAMKRWRHIQQLPRNEKLRILCNISKLKKLLTTRVTFFLHPDNLVFDDNLMPSVIYRGMRNLLPPYDMTEKDFLKQWKCFAIALFSQKYTFDDLYNGSLENADETEFMQQIRQIDDWNKLEDFLQESYRKEQDKSEKTMQLVPKKRFRLFKRLSIVMIIVSILLIAPLAYFGFVKLPFQANLLTAHDAFLASDYGKVIATLQDETPEKLPIAAKYILAFSYITVEQLADQDKEAIMKNVTLKSDEDYLLYWIYNGLGDFDVSVEKAKYIDDPQLIMYGLIKKMEQAKNNPELSGTEREKEVNDLQDQLKKYKEKYYLDEQTIAPENEQKEQAVPNADKEQSQDEQAKKKDEKKQDTQTADKEKKQAKDKKKE